MWFVFIWTSYFSQGLPTCGGRDLPIKRKRREFCGGWCEAGGWWRRAGLAAPRLVSAYLIFQVALNFEKVTKRHGWLAGLARKLKAAQTGEITGFCFTSSCWLQRNSNSTSSSGPSSYVARLDYRLIIWLRVT